MAIIREKWNQLSSQRRRAIKIGAVLLMVLYIYWFIPSASKLVSGPIQVRHVSTKGEVTWATYGPHEKGWVNYSSVPAMLPQAIVAIEDINFWDHHGLDYFEIYQSFKRNLRSRKVIRGGSTITQQLVKNALLSSRRSYTRKLREAIGAYYVESLIDKKQIMAWYLNIVEFGPNVYGVRDAARYYFGKTPSQLTPNECVYLAIILPSPKRYGQSIKNHNLTNHLKKRFAWTIRLLKTQGRLDNLGWQMMANTGNFGAPVMSLAAMGVVAPPPPELEEEEEDSESSEAGSIEVMNVDTNIAPPSPPPAEAPAVDEVPVEQNPVDSSVPTNEEPQDAAPVEDNESEN